MSYELAWPGWRPGIRVEVQDWVGHLLALLVRKEGQGAVEVVQISVVALQIGEGQGGGEGHDGIK